MAKLKIVDEAQPDTLYADLDKGLGKELAVVIGNNTQLVRLSNHVIAIRLHGTNVVSVWDDGFVEYTPGIYLTATTLRRINSVAHKFGLRGSRAGGRFVLHWNSGEEY